MTQIYFISNEDHDKLVAWNGRDDTDVTSEGDLLDRISKAFVGALPVAFRASLVKDNKIAAIQECIDQLETHRENTGADPA